MTSILGISGSLRRGSFNTMLLNAVAQLMPPEATLTIANIRDVPLYDGDVEAQGIPAAVAHLKDQAANADALLLVTPEYNGSIPGVFKNAIDWMSRPPSDIGRVFANRPVAVIGATPGRVGTALAQRTWLGVLRALRVRPYFGAPVYVSGAAKAFSPDGQLVDEELRGKLRDFLIGFVAFTKPQKP